jgi:hypothetical protein
MRGTLVSTAGKKGALCNTELWKAMPHDQKSAYRSRGCRTRNGVLKSVKIQVY